jgi:hypothetical protein
MPLEVFTDDFCGVFAKRAILWAESSEKVGVDVEFADNLRVRKDRDDNLRLGFERAGEVARISTDIVHDDGLPSGGRGPADALIQGDSGVRRHGPFEGTENENVVIPFLFDHVEANPVIARELFVQESHDPFHEGVGGVGGNGNRVESRNQVGWFRLCCGHGE